MNPYNQQPSGPMQPPPGVGPMGPGPQPGFAPAGPPPAFAQPATPLDLGRIASAITVVAGIVVLFCSLLDLYSVTVDPGKVDDSVDGTVNVGIGFYSVVPFNAPVVALAVPILMLVAALTAVPGLLGRRQGTLVSAISAIAATLLGLVLMFANPLPGVELTGDLRREAQRDLDDLDVSSVNQLVDRVVNIGPGAGLIIAVVFGFIASAAAGFIYLRSTTAAPGLAHPMRAPIPPQGPQSGFVPMPPQGGQFTAPTAFIPSAGPDAFDQTQLGTSRPGAPSAGPGAPGGYPGQS